MGLSLENEKRDRVLNAQISGAKRGQVYIGENAVSQEVLDF